MGDYLKQHLDRLLGAVAQLLHERFVPEETSSVPVCALQLPPTALRSCAVTPLSCIMLRCPARQACKIFKICGQLRGSLCDASGDNLYESTDQGCLKWVGPQQHDVLVLLRELRTEDVWTLAVDEAALRNRKASIVVG